jgi:predicted nucleic acid-binding protein
VAAADADDPDHGSVSQFFRSYRGELIVPDTILGELSHMIARHLGPHSEAATLAALTESPFSLVHIADRDVQRACEIVVEYADNPIGFVEASIVAMAERLGVDDLVTLDHRHFGAIRPRHRASLNLLPPQ